MRHRIIYGMLLCMLLVNSTGYCQQIKKPEISSTVDRNKIAIDEHLLLTVNLEIRYQQNHLMPELEPMPDFDVSWLYSSIRVKKINPHMFTTKKITYLLIPKKSGKFKVGSAKLKLYRDYLVTPSIDVEVTDTKSGRKSVDPNLHHAMVDLGSIIFITASVDKKEAWVGEQIDFTFEHFDNAHNTDIQYKLPSTVGFWPVDLDYEFEKSVNISGILYWHGGYKKALFPTRAGELIIGSAHLMYSSNKNFYNQWGDLRSYPVTLNIKSLPEQNKPQNFTGAVGNFTISSAINKTTINKGDAVAIHVTVTGTGNIDLITEIAIPELSSFTLYDSKVHNSIPDGRQSIGGSKTWEYSLVPQQTGEKTIGAFTLSYFDPKKAAYHTVSTKPIEITIQNTGEMIVSDTKIKNTGQTVISSIASDIRFLKPDKQTLASNGSKVYPSPWWFLLYLLPVSTLIVTYSFKRKHDTLEKSPGLRRKTFAWKQAKGRLDEATRLLEKNDIPGYYGKLHECITSYIEDILNVGTGAMNSETIAELLIQNDIDSELAGSIKEILDTCDFFEFAPADVNSYDHRKILDKTYVRLLKMRE
ncbi:MAG: protein BatD [Candidatus Latescibacteria bacterium]|nr:protein BatD [Candidatus Latescibacterota bacterium]